MDSLSKEIYVRYLSSLVVSLVFSAAFLMCGCSIVSLSIFSPLYPNRMWDPLLFMLSIGISLLVVKSFYTHLKASDIAFSKNSAFVQILVDQHNLLFSLTLLVLGSLQAFTVTRLMGYSGQIAWILQYGGFIGFSFAISAISQNLLTLTFDNKPVSLLDIFKDAILQNVLRTLGRMIYFVLFYTSLKSVAWLEYNSLFLNPYVGLLKDFDLSVVRKMYIVGLFIFATWSASLNILQNAITKSLPLIDSDESHLMVVSDYLDNSNANGLIHHLLLGRLADSIAADAKTREQVFNITDINGQVAVWLRLNESCLKKLETFLSGVNKANKQLTAGHSGMIAISRPFEHLNAPLLLPKTAPLKNHSDQEAFGPTIRQLVNETSAFCARLPFLRYLLRDVPFASTWRLFSSGGTNQVVNIWSTAEESHQSGQAVIWATEILGILTLSSYIEDRLGAVQRSLGLILSTIDECLEAMELHFELVGLAPPHSNLTSLKLETHCQIPIVPTPETENATTVNAYRYASDTNLPWRIHATLRWALVSCLRQFGSHLRTMQMNAKRKERLQHLWEMIVVTDDKC